MAFPIATATADARAVIEARVTAVWTGAGRSATDIRWGNTVVNPPPNATYLRATVLLGESEVGGIGAGGQDHKPGLLQLDFLGPKNAADGELLALADPFKAAFQRSNEGGIHCWAVEGPREILDPARSRQTMRVRFMYVEQH